MGSAGGDVILKEVIEVLPEKNVEPHNLVLDNVDQRFGYFVRSIFFFGSSPGLEALLEQLRKGMSRVLVHYPCFAGRLKVNQKQKLEIVCANQGALLGGATSPDLTVAEISESDFDLFFLEPSEEIRSLAELPLLNIQVTHLEKLGEYVITMCNHHTLAEATSAIYFLLNLATQCCGQELLFTPTFDRAPFLARDPPRPQFPHDEFAAQGSDSRYTVSGEQSVLRAVSLRKKVASSSTRTRKAYHVSTERLAAIKQAALDDSKLQGRLAISRCSTFEALAALVWRAHVGAELNQLDPAPVRMRFIMDTRSIVTPPVGKEFCGNAVYPVSVVAPNASELLGETMDRTVKRLQEAKGRVNEEYLKSGMDLLEIHRDYWYHPGSQTVINSWPKAMGFSTGLDFGWGKPTRVEYPMHPGNKAIIFFPFSDTGLDVSVALEQHQFPEFEKLFLSQ